MKKVNVVIFTRVSTADGRQNVNRQLDDLKRTCQDKGWNVVQVISENISGKKKRELRKGLIELIQLAETKKIDKVVITEISRLGRNVRYSLDTMDELTKLGVSVYVQNIGMETLKDDGKENFMLKPILLTLMGFAEMESNLLGERIKSGLERAKKEGRIGGRRKGATKSSDKFLKENKKVIDLLNRKMSIRETAKLAECSTFTVQKVKKLLKEQA